jgi:serine/threonine protein phosphatase PrpC
VSGRDRVAGGGPAAEHTVSNEAIAYVLDAPVRLAVAGRTDVGRQRAENQDDFLVADLGAPTPQDGVLLRPEKHDGRGLAGGEFVLGPLGALLIVADGMGGAAAGGLASRLATLWIHQELAAVWSAERSRTPGVFAAALRGAVERANGRIHQQSIDNPDFRGMGTTATAAGILDGYLYLAQVGDSRAYLVRAGEATQLTRDQSVVQALIDAGTMTEEEAERSNRRNVILQALGTQRQVEVDLTYQPVRRGDALLLCSDGLSRVVRREELAGLVDSVPDLHALAGQLVALANERGGPDNVTVVVARLDGDGLAPPSADDAVGRRVFEP